MIYHVKKKQHNSHMCFVCGIHNDAGLHTEFYELDNQKIISVFKGRALHQSYPKRMHGGIIAGLLDETIGRAIQIFEPDVWGVTVDISIRYLKPVPLDQTLMVVGEITQNRRLIFEGSGYLMNASKDILAVCTAKYMKQAVQTIVKDDDFIEEQWTYVDDQDMPQSFDLPQ
jgi:acyl-coenzyme A thioesterase PaaI-like protein